MVIADVLCAVNLAASVMVNGDEENERRKEHETAIQNAIRNELDVHRRKEMTVIRDDLIRAHKDATGSRLIDKRRQKLMVQKANSMVELNKNNDRDQPMECDRADYTSADTKHPTITTNSSFSITIAKPEVASTFKNTKTRRPLAVPTRESLAKKGSQRNSSLMSKATKNTLSLFDNSLEEDDYDFEEIRIE
eukprot:CAMPEP_0168197938 /NCGR_PEP_ID=MMETSP0139_2-20121125/21473_1 /TAXON_ID=44445 /ORGANISM="Pseudo-nitzschia australis, Strain 10249 10 AB" /LENGTH=191 /DNA_ID=CAMNT_0008122527 /DNA_START=333 /DNA_END=909 /DNA_ORIENTATION=+